MGLYELSDLGNPICQNLSTSTLEVFQVSFFGGESPTFSESNTVTMLSLNLILIGVSVILGVFVIGRICWTKKGRTFLVKTKFIALMLAGLPFLNTVLTLLVLIQIVGRSHWLWACVLAGVYLLCGIITAIVTLVVVSKGRNCFVVFICGLMGVSSLNSVWLLTDTIRKANSDTEKGISDITVKKNELNRVVGYNFYYFQLPVAFVVCTYGISYHGFIENPISGVFITWFVIAALNCAVYHVGEIGRGNNYSTPDRIFWEYQVGTFIYRLCEYVTRLFFIALIACAYKWYALGLILLEVLLWTSIGVTTENKSQKEMQAVKRKNHNSKYSKCKKGGNQEKIYGQ